MVVATTGGRLELGGRLQIFLFGFLVPLIGGQTFMCVKSPAFHFVDKSFKETVIVLKGIIDNLLSSVTIDIAGGQVFGKNLLSKAKRHTFPSELSARSVDSSCLSEIAKKNAVHDALR